MTRRTHRGSDVEVSFDGALCIHAAECVRGLPAVFDRDRRPWVIPDEAGADAVGAVVERCPTGALHYARLDGGRDEQAAEVTTVTPVYNGPLAVRGALVIRRQDGTLTRMTRAALCRCGQSQNKPFCDNSHLEAGFEAPGVQAPGVQAAAGDDPGEQSVARQG